LAFGLFNKKQPSKPEKTPVKAKAPVKKAEAQKPAAPQPVVEEEGFSLDFTNYASPEEVAEIMAPIPASPFTVEGKPVPNPVGLDFGALVGEAPAVPAPEAAPAKAPAPAAPAAKAPTPPPVAEKPASLADSMGMDFNSFVQKAEAMAEAPAAKAPAAPPPAPVAKAAPAAPPPAPAAKAAPPAPPLAPAAKAPAPAAPPQARVPQAPPPVQSNPDTDDTVDFAPPATLDFIPKPAVPPRAPASPSAPQAAKTDDAVDFAAPLNFEVEPKLAPRPVMAPSAPQAPAPAAKAPPPAPQPAAPVAKAPAPPAPPAPKPAAPAAKAVPAAAKGPKSVSKKGPKSKASIAPLVFDAGSSPNSVLIVEVESGKSDVPAMIEEVAMLFANDQAGEALEKLDKAIDGGKLKSWSLAAWLMRFDAYQQLGRKSEFEERALDFVVKFERSPPAWTDAPADSGASRPGSSANINLSGPLSAASASAFAQLRKAAEKQPKLRIDFAKLESIDKEGAKLLFDTLKSLRAAKKEVYISGEGQILNLLRSKAVTGDTHADQAFWLLLLDLYQSLGMLPEFEEAAVDYAVTYEVSPPSWEARPKVQPPAPAKPEASGVRVSSDDSFRLQGEIAGQQDQLFKLLVDYTVKASPVVIDFAHVHRIDFVNAGRLAGVLEKAGQSGKAIVVRGAGEMTIALFAVVGLHQYARIIPRK